MENKSLANEKDNVKSRGQICSSYSEAMSKLEVRLVHKMTDDYHSSLSGSLHPNDAQSIWFDLETLKAFLYHIENEAVQHIPKVEPDRLGIRFYYARYPEFDIWDDYPDMRCFEQDYPDRVNYEKLQTLIGVPTIRRGKLDYDFDPTIAETYLKPLNHKEFGDTYLPGSPVDLSAIGSTPPDENDDIGARNHGQLIPPANSEPSHFYNQ